MCKSESHKSSFIPSSILLWNGLDPSLRICKSLGSFKIILKKLLFTNKHNIAFSQGHGINWIHLSRIRMGMSGLNVHLYNVNIIESDVCLACNSESESALHYFLHCTAYVMHRKQLLSNLRHLLLINDCILPISDKNILNLIIYGSSKFPQNLNVSILRLTCSYISDTKRFIYT